MKPKLIALNVLLLLALVVIGQKAHSNWQQAKVKREKNLAVKVKPVAPPPLTSVAKPDAASAAKYADVATKDLFSKDRNPNVVIDPPKVEPPKPMPPLPVVYGVLGLPSGTKALMAEKTGLTSRAVHEGDKIGEFTISALDPQNVTFDWEDKHITKKIDDLIDRSGAVAQAAGQPAAVPARAAAAPAVPAPAKPGKDVGGGVRACVAGDDSPSGTTADGYTKSVLKTPFGDICNWKSQ